MKRRNFIAIHTPRLNNVRYFLRRAIQNAVLTECNRLDGKIDQLVWEGKYIPGGANVPQDPVFEEKELISKLREEKDLLYFKFKDSICQCAVCSSLENDMSYSKDLRRWFCIKCYDVQQYCEEKYRAGLLDKVLRRIFRLDGKE